MGIKQVESGLRPQTADNLSLDVGLVIANGAIEELWDYTDPLTVVDRLRETEWIDPLGQPQKPYKAGATQGGIDYDPKISQRQVEVDGRRANIRELWRVDMIEPTIKMNFLESRDPDLMQKAHGAADRTRVGYYERIKPRLTVEDTDFWWNLVIIQFVSGQPLPMLYIIQNPHVSSTEAFGQKDKGETILPVTVTGNNTLEDPLGDLWQCAEVWVPSQYGS